MQYSEQSGDAQFKGEAERLKWVWWRAIKMIRGLRAHSLRGETGRAALA